MAVLVGSRKLRPGESGKIRDDLQICPKPTYRGATPQQFRFWNNSNEGIVALPFYYGRMNYSHALIPSPVHHNYDWKFTGKLRKNQVSIVASAKQDLARYNTSTLNLYTGFGKTVVCACLAAYLRKITLVLCDSLILLTQWESTFNDFTDAKVWIVGDKLPEEPPTVIICMTQRVAKIKKYLEDSVGTLIIDEAHSHCTAGKVDSILTTRPNYVIIATATIERRDGAHNMLEMLCGKHVLVEKSSKEFQVYCYETKIKITPIRNRYNAYDFTDLTNKQCNNKERNELIIEIIKQNTQHKILILTWRADHVDLLHKMVTETPVPNEEGEPSLDENDDIIFFQADKMSRSKKTYIDSQVLVGTIAKIGRAFDEKAACATFNGVRINLLILAGTMAFMGLMEQVAGRCFRSEYPNIIYLLDEAPIVNNHWKKAEKWFKSVNGQIHRESV
jgi:hypothetical protein